MFYRCIILHATVRLLPMLQQLSSGLELYGLRPMVQANRVICRELFVPGPLNMVSSASYTAVYKYFGIFDCTICTH